MSLYFNLNLLEEATETSTQAVFGHCPERIG